MKLRSSLTFFEVAAAGAEPSFATALDLFFAGGRDEATLRLIA